MGKIIKYKLYVILGNKPFVVGFISYFVILNYFVLVNSGLLALGDESYNYALKYALLINNFIYVSSIFGILISVYIGTGLIGKDIPNKQIYLILSSVPKRWKYLVSNWLALMIVLAGIVVFMIINYFAVAIPLQIAPSMVDFLRVFSSMYLNFAVVMTATAMGSVVINGYGSAIIGLIQLVVFEIHTTLQVPLVNIYIEMSQTCRQFLVNIAPIRQTYDYSITSQGTINRYVTEPLLISNFGLYQIIFIFLLVIVGVVLFEKKEL